jgi:hypothetical protein
MKSNLVMIDIYAVYLFILQMDIYAAFDHKSLLFPKSRKSVPVAAIVELKDQECI